MASPRALTDEQQLAVAREYRESLISIARLAEKYRCSGRAIWLVLKQRKVPPRRLAEFPRRYTVPLEEHPIIRDAYLDGSGSGMIARRFGYSVRAIRSVLKAQNVIKRRGWAKEPTGFRRCPKCQQELPIGAFGRIQSRPGSKSRAGYCRPCMAAYVRPFNHLARTGLTVDQVERLKKKQGGKCALCRKAKRLGLDHDHKTRIIRGLLCGGCNRLMCALDDSKWMARAIEYRTSNTGHKWPKAKKKK